MDRAAPRRGPALLVVAVLLGALAGTWLGLVQGVHRHATEAAPAAPAAAPTHTGRPASASRAVTSTSRASDTGSAAQRHGTPRRASRDTTNARPDRGEPVGPAQLGHGHGKPRPHQGRD